VVGTVTSPGFSLGTSTGVNNNGDTYVAYLFAHDAGGFPASGGGSTNGITCGSYTGNGSSTGPIVNLGYEPQFIIVKAAAGGTSGSQDWNMIDNMRGWTTSSNEQLNPNLSAAETSQNNIVLNATGFQLITAGSDFNGNGNTYIYIAIRRGPMKVPTTGTSVFAPVTYTGDGSTTSGQLVTAGFPVDMGINRYNRGGAGDWDIVDRLRSLTSIGVSPNSRYLNPYNTNAEASGGYIFDATNTSVDMYGFSASFVQLNYLFRRAPSFFDVVCYTGTGATRTVTHNLAAVPQLIITKVRNSAGYGWFVYPLDATKYMELNSTSAAGVTSSAWNDTAPTASVFTVGPADQTNLSGATLVAYLFATCAGVSKVGSYTGTAATLQIDCGFTGGARFVLIKRTDSTGAWYVWDTARGIIAGNDPYLLLNSTAAEVTNTDYIDTYSVGFEISSTAPAAINASGGTFIFLAIA